MSKRRYSRRTMESLCQSIGPEDGIDPRYLRASTQREVGRKQLQLCRQVEQTLIEALAACGDELLLELNVVSVIPAAGEGRLLVTFTPATGAPPRAPAEYEQRLASALGLLRREVAEAVHRRKVPELIARVIHEG